VYSLACTLYELIFGRAPFGADVEPAIDGHLHGTPALDLTPLVAIDDALLSWLRKCLSRTRRSRPQASSPAPHAPSPEPEPPRRAPSAARAQ
jgi:serine/threonine protein kinase